MNIRNLGYFIAVAESGNITKTAEKLYVSQQALSKHLKDLERDLGVVLFTRNPNFRLTYAGERLLTLAKELQRSEDKLIREMHDIGENRRAKLRLGMTHTCGRALLPETLPLFMNLHPAVDITLTEANMRDLENKLVSDEIDMALTYSPISSPLLAAYEIKSESTLLIAPKKLLEPIYAEMTEEQIESFRSDPDITVLEGQPFLMLKEGDRLRKLIDDHMSKKFFMPNIFLETENIETVFHLAEAGMGFAVYPEIFMSRLHKDKWDHLREMSFEVLRFTDPEMMSALIVASRKNSVATPLEEDFVRICRQAVASNP